MASGVERDKARAAKLRRAALRGHVSARDCWRSITFTLGVSASQKNASTMKLRSKRLIGELSRLPSAPVLKIRERVGKAVRP
jgi:hypothetical protein